VATASVERALFAMVFSETMLRNKMIYILLDDCLVIFIEWDIFFKVDEDDIIKDIYIPSKASNKVVTKIPL